MRYGWIAPDGRYYKCNSWEHDKTAEKELNSSYDKLIKYGWLTVSLGVSGSKYSINCLSWLITQEQYNKLLDLGFTEQELEDECLFVKS